jgi:Carboxypeptidase regulatory-like domain
VSASIAVAAAMALALSGQTQPATQTTQRPGEPTRRPATGLRADTAVIRGRITTVDGRPIAQAEVTVSAPLQQPRRETTDADGRYEARGLAADAYTISVSKSGFATTEFGQRRASYPGRRVNVGDGEVLEHIDLVLPRAGTITGRVSDENGDPVMGATVSLLEARFVNGRRRLVESGNRRRTNDLGRFRLYGVQPGRYVLVAAAAPAGPYRMPGYAPSYYPGAASASDAQPVTIGAADDLSSIEIRLMPGHGVRVAGTVRDASGQPFRGRVRLAGSDRAGALAPPAVEVAAQADGAFEFDGVAPGEYVLQTTFPGSFASAWISVADANVTGIVMTATIGSTVKGHITFEGTPVRVRPQDFQFNFVQTDLDLGPPPGVYRAKIDDDFSFQYVGLFGPLLIRPAGGAAWMLKSVRAGGVDITDTPTLFGTRDQSLADVEVILTNRGPGVSGTVTDGRGHAVESCTAIAFTADRARWGRQSRFIKAAPCGPQGTFSIPGLPESEYLVAAVDRIQGANGTGEWQDPDVLESLVVDAAKVTLADGQTATVSAKLVVRSQP